MSARPAALARLEATIGARLTYRRVKPDVAPARVAAQYEVRDILGTGSFGTVVDAWDPNLQREVAIKCIPSDDPSRLFDMLATEARVLAAIDAPEVVRVHHCLATEVDVGDQHLPCLAIVMERIHGTDLRQWAARQQGEDARISVLLSAARGLEAAHAHGIVHRDFKPENVIVTPEHQARIVDFGLAYQSNQTSSHRALVPTGVLGVGTLGYMAPEVHHGQISAASDQFAFAVTAWELLTGTRPFDPRTSYWRDLDPLDYAGADHLPRRIRAVLGRALQYARERRFETIAELRAELESRGWLEAALWVTGALALGATAATMVATNNKKKQNGK